MSEVFGGTEVNVVHFTHRQNARGNEGVWTTKKFLEFILSILTSINFILLLGIFEMSALYYLISRGNDFATLRKLLEEGQNPNVADAMGNAPLHIAIFKDAENLDEFEANLQVVKELLYFGAKVNHGNKFGNTPLHFAVARRNYKVMRMLLNCKADIHRQDSFGNTAMHYAISNKQLLQVYRSNSNYLANASTADLKAVKLLMKYCPDVNVFNHSFETPLIWAVKQQNLQIFKILLEKGALLSFKDLYGNRALHYALDQREINMIIVAELIRGGSRHDLKNNQSATAIDVYLKTLYSAASSTEQEKANCFLKLFVFQKNTFRNTHFRKIAIISKQQNSLLSRFFWHCRFEIEQMKIDDLAKNYTVYDLACWGFYSCTYARKPPSNNIFQKVLNKLKNGEYGMYCDVIISGVCKDYLATKTAGTGTWVNSKGERKEFLNFDTRFLLCYYLTNFEIFNLMLAFSSSGSFWKICKTCTIFYEKL